MVILVRVKIASISWILIMISGNLMIQLNWVKIDMIMPYLWCTPLLPAHDLTAERNTYAQKTKGKIIEKNKYLYNICTVSKKTEEEMIEKIKQLTVLQFQKYASKLAINSIVFGSLLPRNWYKDCCHPWSTICDSGWSLCWSLWTVHTRIINLQTRGD